MQLRDIDVKLPVGKLTVLVGRVGSGKSALLQGILRELWPLPPDAELQQAPKVAFADQTPVIYNKTLKENVCFGLPYDLERMKRAVDGSCLAHDLRILPNGIDTELGENGVSLSGGQRARVCFC